MFLAGLLIGWIIGNCLFGMADCITEILGGKENGN